MLAQPQQPRVMHRSLQNPSPFCLVQVKHSVEEVNALLTQHQAVLGNQGVVKPTLTVLLPPHLR